MGKERINQLLKKLEKNHQKDIENSAAIFSVAQVAVNQLQEINDQVSTPVPSQQSLSPSKLNKQDLIQRYQDFKGCRKAAKEMGIRFKKTPSWDKLVAAFNLAEILNGLANRHLEENPDPLLQDITVEIRL